MAIPENMQDAVELLIVKKNAEQRRDILGEVEKIYVKRADFNKFFTDLLNTNPYFTALKYFIAAVLIAFCSTLVALVFTAYQYVNR